MSRYISEEKKIEKMTRAELKKYVRDNLSSGKVISVDISEEDDGDGQDFRETGYR